MRASTRSSRPPRSTGSRTTGPCSGTSPASSLRAGGWSPSAGARATSCSCALRSTRSATGWEGPWNFASPEETRRRLEAAGFVGIDTWLTDEPTSFEPGPAFRDYLRTVALSAHVARLEPEAQDDFLDAVIERLAEPAIHFVRLNIVAERGTAP